MPIMNPSDDPYYVADAENILFPEMRTSQVVQKAIQMMLCPYAFPVIVLLVKKR
jgi:hypothetical protein